MFRKLLLFLFLCIPVALIAAAMAFTLWGDQFLLTELRKHSHRLAPWRIEVGGLRTKLLAQFEITLDDVSLTHEKTTIRVRQAKLSSLLSGLSLYRTFREGKELPLTMSLSGPKVQMLAPGTSQPTPPAPWPKEIPFPATSPIPVAASLVVSSGEVSGAYKLKDISTKLNVRLYPAGAEMSGTVNLLAGASDGAAFVPISLNVKAAGTPQNLNLQQFQFHAVGLEGSASGQLKLKPVQGEFRVNLNASDLSRLNLRTEDRAAFGLQDQPTGSLAVNFDAVATAEGEIHGTGALQLNQVELPLRAPAHTVWSGIFAGPSIEGPLSVNAQVPFRTNIHWATKDVKFMPGAFSVILDLTKMAVSSEGKLDKPSGIPLRLELQGAGNANGVKLDSFRAQFHTLKLSGSGELPYPLGQKFLAAFRLDLESLAQFPQLLPMLRQAEGKGASLADAQGAIHAEGSVRLSLDQPSRSMVNFKTFVVRGLRLPLAYAGESLSAKGVLLGNAHIQGKFDAGDLSLADSTGSFDLSALELSLKNKFEKKKGRKLLFRFDAKGNPSRLQIQKVSLEAEGLSASLSGTAAFSEKRAAQLNLRTAARAELAPLHEYLPALPVKISAGTLDAQLSVGGTWLPEGGLERSPLAISGKITAKLGNVEMPEAPKEESKIAPPPERAPLLPNWPAARNAVLDFRAELAAFRRGSLVASGISATGTLRQGKFNANATVANTFGGKASVRNLAGSLLDPHLAVQGTATADGLDLAQMAGFVDSSYGKIVKGTLKANAAFRVPDLWSESILGTASANGDAQVSNGYLSTASFNGLVNEKLSAIPGLGDKAKVNTGGVSANIRTDFSYANSVASLKNFVATTPQRDEMQLAGSISLLFDADLSGEAHLASAPVAGAVREANSDAQGRLVVPVRFHGNLKSPQVDIAAHAVEAMLKKTATREGEKLKNKALDGAKQKVEDALKDAAGNLLKGFGK